mmetsp:Transcript_18932/g.64163  ORF Transcript_18932/g.64163 Transcript_18932/m.64163 type:complete len:218 (-) Transcript_18932:2614-3267(-)
MPGPWRATRTFSFASVTTSAPAQGGRRQCCSCTGSTSASRWRTWPAGLDLRSSPASLGTLSWTCSWRIRSAWGRPPPSSPASSTTLSSWSLRAPSSSSFRPTSRRTWRWTATSPGTRRSTRTALGRSPRTAARTPLLWPSRGREMTRSTRAWSARTEGRSCTWALWRRTTLRVPAGRWTRSCYPCPPSTESTAARSPTGTTRASRRSIPCWTSRARR